MGLEKTFNLSNEIMKVSDHIEKSTFQFDTVIVNFSEKTISELLKGDYISEVPDHVFKSASNSFNVYKHNSIPNTAIFKSPIGAPSVVAFLEEITYAFSIKNIVLYGSAGVLQSDITAGKLIVPNRAFRDEGTSYHYEPSSEFIDVSNCVYVSKILNDLSIDYVQGAIWTTDAFYRETKENFELRKKQGCIAVDMEISAVQAFAKFRELNLFAFVYSADNLDSSKWDKRILGNLDIDSRIKYFKIASEIANNLLLEINKDNGVY